MKTFSSGEIVFVRFPFTDLKGSKRRPGLVLFDTGDADIVVARITSKSPSSEFLDPSCVRVHKLSTLRKNLVERKMGRLTEGDFMRVKAAMEELWRTL